MPATIDEQMAAVRRDGGFPDADGFFDKDGLGDDADFRALHDQVMRTDVARILRDTQSEYTVRVAPDIQLVADQDFYEVPERAALGGLRHAVFIDPSTDVEIPMPQIPREDAGLYSGAAFWRPGWATPFAFVFRDEQIQILPSPSANAGVLGQVRLYYYRRFSRAILSSDARQITALPAADQATVSSVPGAWAAGQKLDAHRPSGLYRVTADDQEIQAVAGPTVTFTADLPSDVRVNDWLSLAETTPVVEVPEDMHGFASWNVVARAMNALGDEAGERRAIERAARIENDLRAMLAPRADGNRRKIINRHNRLRGGGW